MQNWDLITPILENIEKKGGWVNTHTHLDRAYTITPETLKHANAPLKAKWDLVDDLKKRSSVDQIYDRMAYSLERQLEQGVTALGTFIDVDEVIQDKAILAADRLREKYKDVIQLKFLNQTLKGVLTPDAREWFDRGAEFVDIIGGLPGKDQGHEAEHFDVLLGTAKRMGKMVHVHTDQFNDQTETETELLALKTIEHGMEGKTCVIHGVSVAAHPIQYRQKVYTLLKKAKVQWICCPTAYIDARRNETLTVTHNSISPVDELVPAGISVGIGTDNIADIYLPFGTGSMLEELLQLIRCTRIFDPELLAAIATTNGRKILGISA